MLIFWARGPWGPLGPRCRIGGRLYYLLSGKLPTVRQATYYQASYLLSGMHPSVAAYFAPSNCIHAPNQSIDMHLKGIDMHSNVSIYFAPNNRILFQVTCFRKNEKITRPHFVKVVCFERNLKTNTNIASLRI